jgi:ribosomal protein S18 acetylase RimI-like enzyme
VDIIVRTAVPEDAPAITRLVLEVADEVVAREPTVRRIPSGMIVERLYNDRVRDRERRVLVATGDGRVAGFVDAALVRTADSSLPDAPDLNAYVEELIVTSTARRRQIGSMLARAVEAWAVDVGARMMTLDTHVTNEAARGLYRSLGYREMGVILAKDLQVH